MTADQLTRGRDAYDRRSWAEALDALAAADARAPLDVADLELLATAAYMAGDDERFERTMERAHHASLERDDVANGVRCAIWTGISLALRREVGPASGWFARAERLLGDAGDCVERGYLLLPEILAHEAAGAYEAAAEKSAAAVEIGRRFGDADLQALATHANGLALLGQGRSDEGLPLLDEAMVAVTAGELSPIVTGIVYCAVIAGCHEVVDVRRAREWTEALARWCDDQQGLVSFTGKCLLHRAEILHLRGAWPEALDEARRASGRFEDDESPFAAGQALYYQGEVHRLRGEHERAEEAYRVAARHGWEPQPGLALLRLAQGDTAAAVGAIRRLAGETTSPARRARLLPAAVEILLAAGEVDEARAACAELRASDGGESELLRAMRRHAEGAVDLAAGDAWAALSRLRAAADAYARLDVPYERARVRELLGRACDAVGDRDTAALELDAARAEFAALGAEVDLARVEGGPVATPTDTHGLTPREHEVLRLLAAGRTNRHIATDLVISERTVARHVSNIFAKLGLSSRAAATAYAYEHGLV